MTHSKMRAEKSVEVTVEELHFDSSAVSSSFQSQESLSSLEYFC